MEEVPVHHDDIEMELTESDKTPVDQIVSFTKEMSTSKTVSDSTSLAVDSSVLLQYEPAVTGPVSEEAAPNDLSLVDEKETAEQQIRNEILAKLRKEMRNSADFAYLVLMAYMRANPLFVAVDAEENGQNRLAEYEPPIDENTVSSDTDNEMPVLSSIHNQTSEESPTSSSSFVSPPILEAHDRIVDAPPLVQELHESALEDITSSVFNKTTRPLLKEVLAFNPKKMLLWFLLLKPFVRSPSVPSSSVPLPVVQPPLVSSPSVPSPSVSLPVVQPLVVPSPFVPSSSVPLPVVQPPSVPSTVVRPRSVPCRLVSSTPVPSDLVRVPLIVKPVVQSPSVPTPTPISSNEKPPSTLKEALENMFKSNNSQNNNESGSSESPPTCEKSNSDISRGNEPTKTPTTIRIMASVFPIEPRTSKEPSEFNFDGPSLVGVWKNGQRVNEPTQSDVTLNQEPESKQEPITPQVSEGQTSTDQIVQTVETDKLKRRKRDLIRKEGVLSKESEEKRDVVMESETKEATFEEVELIEEDNHVGGKAEQALERELLEGEVEYMDTSEEQQDYTEQNSEDVQIVREVIKPKNKESEKEKKIVSSDQKPSKFVRISSDEDNQASVIIEVVENPLNINRKSLKRNEGVAYLIEILMKKQMEELDFACEFGWSDVIGKMEKALENRASKHEARYIQIRKLQWNSFSDKNGIALHRFLRMFKEKYLKELKIGRMENMQNSEQRIVEKLIEEAFLHPQWKYIKRIEIRETIDTELESFYSADQLILNVISVDKSEARDLLIQFRDKTTQNQNDETSAKKEKVPPPMFDIRLNQAFVLQQFRSFYKSEISEDNGSYPMLFSWTPKLNENIKLICKFERNRLQGKVLHQSDFQNETLESCFE
uniref:SPK domain-containing protein n=1 Tax=Caenorhabditis tropicalis TaxID=1561998 RepID=A0A1I7TAQ5_9PELO